MASTQQQKKGDPSPAPPPPGPVKAAIGYALGALIGLTILWVVAGLLRKPPQRYIDELPLLTIVAEVRDLRSTEARKQLALLERSVAGLGLTVQGPCSAPLLVPGAKPGDLPTAVPLETMTPEQFDLAAPYLGVGGWISPRLIAPDLQSVVLRACPSAGQPFAADVAPRLLTLLRDPGFNLLTLTPYSHALGLEEPAARLKANLVFGVQTVIVFALSDAKQAGTPGFQALLLKSVEDYKSKAKVRSAVCDGSYLHYAAAVRLQRKDLRSDDMGPADPQALIDLAASAGIPRLCARDGSFAQIEVTTDAEGPANNALGFDVVANTPRFPLLSGPYRFDRAARR